MKLLPSGPPYSVFATTPCGVEAVPADFRLPLLPMEKEVRVPLDVPVKFSSAMYIVFPVWSYVSQAGSLLPVELELLKARLLPLNVR